MEFNNISGIRKRAPLNGRNTIKDVIKRLNETYDHSMSHVGLIQNNFYENSNVVAESYEVPAGRNAMASGPLTVSDGVSITVSPGSSITIV